MPYASCKRGSLQAFCKLLDFIAEMHKLPAEVFFCKAFPCMKKVFAGDVAIGVQEEESSKFSSEKQGSLLSVNTQ